MQGGSGLSLEDDRQVRLAGGPGRPDAVTLQRAGDAGPAQGAAGQGARPVGAGQRRGDPGGPRLLEEARRPARPRCATWCRWPWARRQAPGGLPFERRHGRRAGSTDFLGPARRPGRASTSCRRRPASRARCGPTRCAATRGWRFLRRWGLGACLADDMGLGKTVQTLALIQRDWAGRTSRPARRCSICPMSVVGNWKKEAARFTPDLPVLVHHGLKRARGRRLQEGGRQARPGPLQLRPAAPRLRRSSRR